MGGTLDDVALAIKSANAGASLITFDLFFDAPEDLRRAAAAVTPGLIAGLYGVDERDVHVYPCPSFGALKVTLPRSTTSGAVDERDFDGVQQHVFLLDVPV